MEANMGEPNSDESLNTGNDQSARSGDRPPPRRGELTAFIRFQLSKMSTRNEHHKFEDLCRSFSRQRIARNIIPATGPVSAGGDQARDFETFLTYMKTTLRPLGVFLGIEEGQTIVFCCSLQKSAINSKLSSDV